mmetsp:Transcript_22265/g.39653  ORF Transcript_22265/g.39653 Transcript_22265/m.39653 type:complete len:85 (-) Transcript_22265:785-1039(-)
MCHQCNPISIRYPNLPHRLPNDPFLPMEQVIGKLARSKAREGNDRGVRGVVQSATLGTFRDDTLSGREVWASYLLHWSESQQSI